MITNKFYIDRLYVKQYPTAPNAVAKVHWVCVLKRGKGTLFAYGITELDPPTPNNFVNIAQLQAQQVIDWVVAKQGGPQWVQSFIAAHEPQMQQSEAEAEFEPWHIPLINPLKFDPNNV